MTLYLLAIFFLLFTIQTTSQPYGELAQTLVSNNYAKLCSEIPSLNNSTLPTNVKTLRKAILGARNMLDIFVLAYPNKTDNKKFADLWAKIRQDMDGGYEVIGAFQDLPHSGANYTEADVIRLREPCILWKATFLANSKKWNYFEYLRNPSLRTLYHRPSVPGFFWKLSGVLPDLRYSGPQNIARLAQGIILVAQSKYNNLLTLQNITESKNQHHFHDFRKLTRGILAIETDFETTIFNVSNCEHFLASVSCMKGVYDNLGDLNDLYVKYEYYLSKGNVPAAEEAKTEVIQKWDDIVVWMKDNDIGEKIQCLLDTVTENKK